MARLIIFLYFALQFFLLNKVAAQEKFEIFGTVPKEYEAADVKIKANDNPSFSEINTAVKDGKFSLSGYTTQKYERISITISGGNKSSKGTYFFISSGRMEIHLDSLADERYESKITYRNAPLANDEKKYMAYTFPTRDSAAKASSLWRNATIGKWKGFDLDSLYSAYYSFRKKKLLRNIEFIKQNPDSYISMYYFQRELLAPTASTLIPPDSLLSVYAGFSQDLKSTSLGKSNFDAIKKRQGLLVKKEMPVFSFKTNTGHEYNLSNFRNQKYVLICFWASWCRACIKNIPALKEIAKEYSDKGLQVISVSIDNDSINWLKAVEKFSMPWMQTCDLPAYISGVPVKSLYDIQLVPQYFLLDIKGNLIYRDIELKDYDNPPALRKMLKEVLDRQDVAIKNQ